MALTSDDDNLIRSCLEGDRQAFDTLVSRHYRIVYSVAQRTLGNAEAASDITQETFVRAYSRLHTYRTGSSFLSWIRRIAVNLCIDHIRANRRSNVSLEGQLESGVEHADDRRSASPQDTLEMNEDAQRVLAAVRQLPEKQRVVLILRHIEGLKLEEIASDLSLPLGTVKTLLFRGRQTVRGLVGEL